MEDIEMKCAHCKRSLDIVDVNKVICHCDKVNYPLVLAIGMCDKELILELIRRGADVKFRCTFGGEEELKKANDPEFSEDERSFFLEMAERNRNVLTPLMVAANMTNGRLDMLEIVKLLISKGADINARDDKGAPVWHHTGRKETIEFFLDKGVDINARDDKGWTELHTQAFLGNKECVELLLRRGANPNLLNKKGDKPLDLAIDRKNKDVIELLGKPSGPSVLQKSSGTCSVLLLAIIGVFILVVCIIPVFFSLLCFY